MENSLNSKRTKEQNKKELLNLRFSTTVFKSNVFIYGDKIALISVVKEEPIGIIVQNKLIADTQKQVFEILWRTSLNPDVK